MTNTDASGAPEKFITIADAARTLGVKPFKVDRAARFGLIPIYRLFNSRRLVRLSEVIAVIEASRQGGAK